jgi:hypothetical protein
VNAHSRPGGVLYPYSVVYLRTLGRASSSTSLPRAEASPLLAALGRAHYPVSGVTIAVPLDGSAVDASTLRARIGRGVEVGVFPDWLLIETPEPLPSRSAVVCRLRTVITAVDGAVAPSAAARHELGLYLSVDEKALRATRARC